MTYHLAIDLGASSGRHILGYIDNGRLCLEEIYRFENGIKNENGFLVWDIDYIFSEIKKGLKICRQAGKIPVTVAIDTWGVDYVLLDKNKKEISPCVSYRDKRTFGIPEEIDKIIPREELYKETGIQATNYNTIYQLYCDKKSGKLNGAKYCLMMPEYFSFKLTGVLKSEYTISSTGGTLQAKNAMRDNNLLKKLGINADIFPPLLMPGELVGKFTEEVKEAVGFDAEVIFCASHDTASAVASSSAGVNGIYLVSGTWSLIGTENENAVTVKEAMEMGFTNEGGMNDSYRFLKNIMGMWLIQGIRKSLDGKYSFDEMAKLAMNSEFIQYIDPNADAFMAPDNMLDAIRNYLGEPDLPLGDVLNCVYHSLAKTYAEAVKSIEKLCDKKTDAINIVGGGCQNKYLNSLVAEYTGKKIIAGPIEASAIGNIAVQMMYADKGLSPDKIRNIIEKLSSETINFCSI
ncbi:MAG: rhamnulokinase [Clostridia bacterium]|nr:rhamnulokinase [Clostridia bacterium]